MSVCVAPPKKPAELKLDPHNQVLFGRLQCGTFVVLWNKPVLEQLKTTCTCKHSCAHISTNSVKFVY